VTALERGLDVLLALGHGTERLTLSQVAERVQLTRGTTRRFLLTLQTLHYIDSDGKFFWLTPKVLQFSNAYLAANSIAEAARPAIRKASELMGESSSVATLDGFDVVYIARVETHRIFSSGLDVGSRLPAFCSSLGRVLLSGMSDEAVEAFAAKAPMEARTPRTVIGVGPLLARIHEVRKTGYALIDGEVELGVRSIAVPIYNPRGQIIAALNVGTSAARASVDKMKKQFLPVLRSAACEIEATLKTWNQG
jgi:IclR family pca regulon transcriptional regulator